MNKTVFTGACTALVTPFWGGKVNYPMMEQLIRRQLEAGIKALVICGTTGESPTLSDEEKIECTGCSDFSEYIYHYGWCTVGTCDYFACQSKRRNI